MQTTNEYSTALPGWIEATLIQPETGGLCLPTRKSIESAVRGKGRTLSGQEVTPVIGSFIKGSF